MPNSDQPPLPIRAWPLSPGSRIGLNLLRLCVRRLLDTVFTSNVVDLTNASTTSSGAHLDRTPDKPLSVAKRPTWILAFGGDLLEQDFQGFAIYRPGAMSKNGLKKAVQLRSYSLAATMPTLKSK